MSEIINKEFENEHIVVLDKPCGVLSVPSRMGVADERPVLGIELQKSLGRPIYPVHRLDEETSGLIIYAKTPEAQKLLSRAFESHHVQKTYQALTTTQTNYTSLIKTTFTNHLVRGKKRSFEATHGKWAETYIADIQHHLNDGLLWTLAPKTGRSHQLRVQLAMRGYPIWGDKLYGSDQSLPESLILPSGSFHDRAIGLRAIQLEFSDGAIEKKLLMPLTLQVHGW